MFRINKLEVKLPTTSFRFIFNVQYNLLQIISRGSTDISDLQQIKFLARALEYLRLQPIMRFKIFPNPITVAESCACLTSSGVEQWSRKLKVVSSNLS